MNDRRLTLIVIAVVSSLGLLFGWWLFWFLCDDAFIAFRYVSNSVAGHGYVWNAPPFRPVDGYTSFAWVALLDLVWRITGIEPPDSANVLLLLFAFGQLYLMFRMLLRLPLRPEHESLRLPFLALAVAGVLTNRTFLAWTSSGLETAMFNFLLIAWVYLAMFRGTDTVRRFGELVAVTVLLTLTRPDGLLYLGATAFLMFVSWPARTPADRTGTFAAGIAGLGALALYFGWRMAIYGAPLPNTFYAKVVKSQPGMGLRYLASFMLEYGLWWWLILVVAAFVAIARTLRRDPWTFRRVCDRLVHATPVLAVLGHAGYYTLVVGGDHFEYRVLSQLVPLLWVAVVWAVDRMALPRARALGSIAVLLVLSWPLPWIHWAHTREIESRDETFALKYPVAQHLPFGTRWYGELFDHLQSELIGRMICMRYQEHAVFYRHKLETLPTREEGAEMSNEGYPVHAAGEVGYAGWVLPNIAVIDSFGLNDWYVARNKETERPFMAHSRVAPPGYLEAFRPNVHLVDGHWKVRERDNELTAREIEDIQHMYDVWLANLK
jgi:arabinofuranosyltransferase